MSSGITRQALRRHRWSLLGPAVTQALAAAVVGAMLVGRASLAGSPAADTASGRVVLDSMAAFIGASVYLSILIVCVTMNVALRQQRRDLAMLRVIGATPGQIRRCASRQAAVVAVPASLAGLVAAVPLGALWLAALTAHEVVPPSVHFRPQLSVVPVVLGIGLATSVTGTLIATVRLSRVPPATALTESHTARRSHPRRAAAGVVLILAGVVLSSILARLAPDQAADAALFVMIAECLGVAMVVPLVTRAVATRLVSVLPQGLPRLAVDNLSAGSRSLSGALIPLVLAVAFATVQVGLHATAAHVTGVPEPAAALWTDYAGTAIYAAFAAVAALNCLLTILVGRGRDLAVMQLAGAERGALVRILTIEASIVTAIALLLGLWVAAVTATPMLYTSLGTWLPYLPGPLIAGGVVLVAAVVATGMIAPAAVLTRRPPLQVTG